MFRPLVSSQEIVATTGEHSYTAGNVNWCNLYGEQYEGSLKN